jgi:hypothetical protein
VCSRQQDCKGPTIAPPNHQAPPQPSRTGFREAMPLICVVRENGDPPTG